MGQGRGDGQGLKGRVVVMGLKGAKVASCPAKRVAGKEEDKKSMPFKASGTSGERFRVE